MKVSLANLRTKHQRHISKICVLAAGFGQGPKGFKSTCANWDTLISLEEADAAIKTYRKTNVNIKRFWYALEGACVKAVENPGKVFAANALLRVKCEDGLLRIRLPSGRYLHYWGAKTFEGKFGQQVAFDGVDKGMPVRKQTYGGKLCIAGDAQVLTRAGWKPIRHVTESDLIWDGVEWVECDGLAYQGEKTTFDVDGVRMTGDHKILTEEGWLDASTSQGHYRADVRVPDAPVSHQEKRTRIENVRPTGRTEPVFDLINCGPRSRFTVLTKTGPLIVHNCENVAQAIARDLLCHAMLNLDKADFDLIAHVHDETVSENVSHNDVDRYNDIMSDIPEWAAGCPVSAKTFFCEPDSFGFSRYAK